ncbi:DNA repair protein rad50 [Calliopsis andreniformis]|uniref:DNA repair protein rad50 n=1 Tax=Calliopsis andreniformis TaxID=337506 RepID=UPI003FCD2878
MSRIRRLSVRGIRNFGDDSEEVTIRFSRPLTLILGPNGTGKTTIIEALKFATCGEFPPNSDRGKYFIHDPTLSSTSIVRGVVKAEIFDAKGNLYIICRPIECTKTASTMRFKTLDSALSRIQKGTKEVISITNRCTNVNSELTLAMGISKPILEYVIFCHQEDLSWPFEDGKKLKEKFDEIFDSAKFNKALESIMKYIKEMKQKTLILKEQKKNYQQTVAEVEDKETKLADHKKRLENVKTKIEEMRKELEPINGKVKKIAEMDSEYKNLLAEEKSKKAEYEMSKEQLNRLKENIQEIFEGTLDELETEIKSQQKIFITKSKEIKELEIKLKEIADKEPKISSMLADERVISGSLKQQIKDQEKKVYMRNKILNETLSAWNLEPVGSNVSEIEVIALTKRLEGKMRELEHNVEENRLEREQEEKKLQKEVDLLRSEYSKVESEKELKENEVLEARDEINRIKLEIMQLSAAASKLDSIESRMEAVKSKIQRLNEAMNVEDAKKDFLDKVKSRDETEALLNAIDEEIALLLKQSSLQAELELHKKTLLSKEEEVEKLKSKHETTIINLMDIKKLSYTKLKNKLDTTQKELVNQTESIKQRIRAEEHNHTTLLATMAHTERELQKKKKEIESDKAKISAICNYKDFDEMLLLQSKKVKDLQDKRGLYAHQGAAYKEYMRQLKEENPCCPLCHRNFEKRETIANLLKEMEIEMESHPNRLKECEIELKVQQEKYDKMLQLKPVVEKVLQSEEIELDKLTNDLEKSKNRLAKSKTSIQELKETVSGPENKLTTCKNITEDIMLWDRYIDEISDLKQKIDNLEARMNVAGIEGKRSLSEAQAQREELKVSLKNIRDDIEKLQSTINVHNDKMNTAREEQNSLHEEQLRIRSDVQKLKQLKEKQDEFFTKEISLGKVVDVLREKVMTAESELKSGMSRLEKKKKENWEKQEIDRKLIAEGTRRLSELQKVQDDVDAFVYRKIPEALQRSESKIKHYETMINDLSSEKSNIDTSISNLKEEIARQEIRKRELSDNIMLRKIQETTKVLQREYLSLVEKIKDINHAQIMEEWRSLQNREQALLRQENMLKGNQEELDRAIRQYTQELKKETYRMARKKYKSKCIELTVTEEAILNLQAYSRALDIAMIEYHNERMASVNRIMKQLWKLVYTGTDTTSVEIQTNATEGIGSMRRTYNYKLVQTKHGHVIDMKGRCSAGQKVLASIIIRLALAETFCKDCGILALDEPTTNLDQENADSLADALAKVVKLRSQHQKNFQLIVISHDEKFLLKLAELNNNKGYYRLYRKPSGYTAIRHCRMENPEYLEVDDIKEEMSSDEEVTEQSGSSRNNHLSSSAYGTMITDYSRQRKRTIRDTDSEDHSDNRSSKRRYFLDENVN